MINLVVAMTTTDNEEKASQMALMLVEQKLAACVQIERIRSFYRWEEMIHDDEEFRLMIKTVSNKIKDVEKLIFANHNYELPEFVVIPVMDSSKAYGKWVEKEVQ